MFMFKFIYFKKIKQLSGFKIKLRCKNRRWNFGTQNNTASLKKTRADMNIFKLGQIRWDFQVSIFLFILAPEVGLEPTTFWLTAKRSTIELLRNVTFKKIL